MSQVSLDDLNDQQRQSVTVYRNLLDRLRNGVEEQIADDCKIVVRWHECDFMGLCSIDPIQSDSIDVKHNKVVETILLQHNNVVSTAIKINDELASSLNIDKTLVWRSFFDDET